jgi:ATP-dependent protease ClpP protease subunit
MKFWNLAGSADELTLMVVGVLDGDTLDEPSVSTRDLVADLLASPTAKRITVRINSQGGSLFGGIAVYNALESHPASVVAIVDGVAASAASVIAMAGRTVMGRGSKLMIHNPYMLTVGDARELRKTADVLDKVRESLVSIYQAKTRKSPDELRTLLDAETWMDPETAVRNRFADEIAKAPPVQNSIARVALGQMHDLARLHDEAEEQKAIRFMVAAATARRL